MHVTRPPTIHATPPVQAATRRRRCTSAGTSTAPAGVLCWWTATSGSYTCLQALHKRHAGLQARDPAAAAVVLVDGCMLLAGCRNWSSCSRFSNSVAKFYSVPIPNEKPLDYLKVLELRTHQARANTPFEHCSLHKLLWEACCIPLLWVRAGDGEDWRARARGAICAGVYCTVQRV